MLDVTLYRGEKFGLELNKVYILEIEMHRLFRTDSFNTAKRTCGGLILDDMPEDEIRVLQGPKIPEKRKLLKNSPLPYQIINGSCDYRVLSIGKIHLPVVKKKTY